MAYTVRPLTETEFEKVVDYFLKLTSEDDERMAIDRKSLPDRDAWIQLLIDDYHKPLPERQFCYVGWVLNDELIGHCGINKIKFGIEAFIHLHLWSPEARNHGLGMHFFIAALDFYFKHFFLQKIICEPNAANPAPNKLLLKAGFKFFETYSTKPSILNYEHTVNRYELNKEDFCLKTF